jgi:hypothetical protein
MKCHDFYAFDVKVEMTVVEQSVALLIDNLLSLHHGSIVPLTIILLRVFG